MSESNSESESEESYRTGPDSDGARSSKSLGKAPARHHGASSRELEFPGSAEDTPLAECEDGLEYARRLYCAMEPTGNFSDPGDPSASNTS
jgi:hypothetical protein